MGLSSGRSSSSSISKGKAAEVPFLLEQHLPKRAHTLVSPLSNDDREVLTYMLAFGLHLQMLAGLVFPAQKLQCKPSSAKVGLKIPSQSFQSLSSTSSSRPRKATSLFAHKTSCSCDCFSCYSSFWSRWAASPNRDVLSKIIEIAEMAEDDEDYKLERGKENTKKQEKKHVLSKGKKSKGDKWKLQGKQGTLKPSMSLPMSKTVKSMPATPNSDSVSVCTSMDVMYGALWDNAGMDKASRAAMHIMGGSVMHIEAKMDTDMNDATTLLVKQARTAQISAGEASLIVASGQGKTAAVLEDEVEGSSSAQASPGDPLHNKSNGRLPRPAKRKSNQIMPLDFEGTFTITEDEEELLGQVNESREGCASPRLVCGNASDKGVLSRVFPHTLCDIASRLWELVSLGPRGHTEEYY